MIRYNRERNDLFSKVAELTKAYDRTRDELINSKGKGNGYKEKLRLANQALKTLTNKVVQYESERGHLMGHQGPSSVGMDENRHPNHPGAKGDTHHSSNHRVGSSADAADIKDAIHKVMHDENFKQQVNKLLNHQ